MAANDALTDLHRIGADSLQQLEIINMNTAELYAIKNTLNDMALKGVYIKK